MDMWVLCPGLGCKQGAGSGSLCSRHNVATIIHSVWGA